MGIAGFLMDGLVGVDGGKWYNARFHAVDAHGNKIPGIEFEHPVQADGPKNVIPEVTEHPQRVSLHRESQSFYDNAGHKHDVGK